MFREMASEMTDKEIRICMSILFEGSIIVEINRDIVQNAIDIKFKAMGVLENKVYKVSLLPDTVEGLSKGITIKVDGLYLYEQFMIAKGYSDYWKDNYFI